MKCLTCKKSVTKDTKRVRFLREPTPYTVNERWVRYVYLGDAPWPQTIADCRKYTNQQVVAVSRLNKHDYVTDRTEDKGIDYFQEWDGESYLPRFGFFCSNTCASEFGRAAAEAIKAGRLVHK